MLCTTGNLWCVQNSAGTFEVAPPEAHRPVVSQRNATHHLMPSMWMGVGSQGGFVSMVVPLIPIAAIQPVKRVTADRCTALQLVQTPCQCTPWLWIQCA